MARDTIHLSDELEQRNDVLFQKRGFSEESPVYGNLNSAATDQLADALRPVRIIVEHRCGNTFQVPVCTVCGKCRWVVRDSHNQVRPNQKMASCEACKRAQCRAKAGCS